MSAGEATGGTLSLRSRDRQDRIVGRVFLGFLLLSLAVGFVTLGALIVDVLVDGVPYLDWQLLSEPPSPSPTQSFPSGPNWRVVGPLKVESTPVITLRPKPTGVPPPAGLTVIVTSSVLESVPSLPVRRRTYVPATEKLADVLSALALPNVTVPGPENLVQVVVSEPPGGRPSSPAVPESDAALGSVIV